MNHDKSSQINGYLDGILNDAEIAELNAWIKDAPQNAAAFAKMVRLHDRMQAVLNAKALIGTHSERADSREVAVNPQGIGSSRRRKGVVGGVAALLAAVFISVWWSYPPSVSAATELDRLIEKTVTGDRSYVIRNLDDLPEKPDERRPPIDGAVLHVRQPDQYVLVRQFPDGRKFITGSDGERSWSIPLNGAVRLSKDPLRFRGPVPGHQHGIPFANLRSDLVQLRDAYMISTLKTNAAGNRGLLAVKKSSDYRGPNRVELWYDEKTGVILRMVFKGMPKAHGGPDRVSVELADQTALGSEFFRHDTHHSSDRRVLEDD